jgi:hypothetical protein
MKDSTFMIAYMPTPQNAGREAKRYTSLAAVERDFGRASIEYETCEVMFRRGAIKVLIGSHLLGGGPN